MGKMLGKTKKKIGAIVACGCLVLSLGAALMVAAADTEPVMTAGTKIVAMPVSSISLHNAIKVKVEDGVTLYSTDGGETWSETAPVGRIDLQNAIKVKIEDGVTLYSTDGGETWSKTAPVGGAFAVQFAPFDQAPIIEAGEKLVPVRAVLETLNFSVDWNQDTQEITAVDNKGKTIKLQIGSQTMFVGEDEITLDAPPVVVNGRTLMGAYAIGKAVAADINWDENANTLSIISGNIMFLQSL